MNSYRSFNKLSTMTKNSNAECLVQQIAWDFDDESPLSTFTSGSTIAPSNFSQLPNLPDYLSQCKIELNHTKNGAIVPLYVPKLALNLVLSECTHSQMVEYLRKPEYTSVGIGYYEQWAVLAFGTNSTAGSFSSSANLSDIGLRYFFLVSSLLLGLFIFI